MRTVLAFLVAPIFPGLLVGVPGIVAGKAGEGLWLIGLGAMLGYPTALLVGAPLHFLLRSRGRTGVWAYSAGGALMGALIYFVSSPPVNWTAAGIGLSEDMLRTFPTLLPLGILSGILAAVCFWFIARPDRNPA